jgi:predicted dehydrogenase
LVSSAAALAASLAARAEAQAPAAAAKADPFRFGIIGSGGQGRGALMNAALRIPGVSFTAVCDIRDDNRTEGLKVAGAQAKGFVDYRDFLDKAEVDAVIIATPLSTHSQIAIAAFDAGKHVFCEKTMARSIDECKAMLRAQKRAGKLLQIGHHLRYSPLYAHAKNFIASGVIGRIVNVKAQWNRHGDWRRPEPKGAFDFGKWGYSTPSQLFNWRLYQQFSGGLMTELASHQTDVMNWVLNATPTAITGVGGLDYYKDGRTVYDNVHVVYEYPDGIKFSYESLTANQQSPYGEAYEMIQGDKGTLVLSNVPKSRGLLFMEPKAQGPEWAQFAGKTEVNGQTAVTLDAARSPGQSVRIPGQDVFVAEGAKSTYQLELEDFIQCVRTGKQPFCNGEVGIRSATPALVALEAMQKQTRIAIPSDFYEA